jgi:hypothetical protein
MQKINKINSILYKSNKFNYGQLLVNNNVLLSVRSDILQNKFILSNKFIKFNKLLNLYNKKIISYNTFNFLSKKLNLISKKSNFKYSFLNVLVEFAWESGLLLKDKKKTKKLTFIKN